MFRKPTSLLELPPEIWSKICKLAVTYDKKIAVARSRDILYRLEKVSWCYFHEGCVEHRKKGGIWRVAPPAITRPCRLIRLETLPHFYKTNVFVIYGCGNVAERLKAWLDAIGQDNRALLRRFYYHPMRSHQGSLLDSLASNGWATQRGVVSQVSWQSFADTQWIRASAHEERNADSRDPSIVADYCSS